jgi:cellulose synthase/poly-beta-1,6-N-acetylglucosamine synthase-like glycosyltransferase
VVDDTSPDGTGEMVEHLQRLYPQLFLLRGKKEGLGKAYIRGFQHAIRVLKADAVFEMDADFSHNPNDIPRFIQALEKGSDFVIGSRYIKGGSIPKEWSLLRKMNSKFGNVFARYIAGLREVKDCTSGFRAIRTSLLKQIHLNRLDVAGYAFQMNLLFEALRKGAIVTEVPIAFKDRVYGQSKIRIKDVREFIAHSFYLRAPFLKLFFSPYTVSAVLIAFVAAVIFKFTGGFNPRLMLFPAVFLFSIVMTLQGLLNLYSMLYAWEDVETIENDSAPKVFFKPHLSFTALVPARNEENVIQDTIEAIANIDYPSALKEIIIICKTDDTGTIAKVRELITKLQRTNIKLATFDDEPVNKPHALNVGLAQAKKDIVVVFDAEDQPHDQIYNIINTVMLRDNVEIVQAGVQLMNYRSSWFATLNVLEYFFWFKSALHFFAKMGAIPLGGNTVFLRRKLLLQQGGWDEECLTEDADIGIRLSALDTPIRVVYDEEFVTKEETPTDVGSFIKQRTRWNMGFMQIILKGEWLQLPTLSQKLLILYVLLMPELQALAFLFIPLSLFLILTYKLPVIYAMFSIVPSILLLLQLIMYIVGLYEFTRAYKLPFSVFMPIRLMLTFYPFQLLLGLSAFRALLRMISGNNHWEKTLHINAHRETPTMQIAY